MYEFSVYHQTRLHPQIEPLVAVAILQTCGLPHLFALLIVLQQVYLG